MTVAEVFQEISAADFFYRNRDIAGFTSPSRSIYSTIRELVENSLDACEALGVPPEIYVRISQESVFGERRLGESVVTRQPERKNEPHTEEEDREGPGTYEIRVEDNGIGIPGDIIASAFGQVLYGSKYKLRQTRGQFGLGGKMALLYGQITTHSEAQIISSNNPKSKITEVVLRIDIQHNRPIVLKTKQHPNKRHWRGTMIQFRTEADYTRAKAQILEYMKQTAIIVPYANITFVDPRGRLYRFVRGTTTVPPAPTESSPHPHGVDVETVQRMLKTTEARTLPEFLRKNFQRIGETTALNFLDYASLGIDDESIRRMLKLADEGTLRSFVRKNVPYAEDTALQRFFRKTKLPQRKKLGELTAEEMTRFVSAMKTSSDFLTPKSMTPERIVKLVKAMRSYADFLSPDPSCLSPLGADLLATGIKKELGITDDDIDKGNAFVGTIQRRPATYEGFPFIVEVGLASATTIQTEGKIPLFRFANKIPLLFDEASDVSWKVVNQSIDWRNYRVTPGDTPVAVFVHLCSTKIPYKTVGKEFIADRPDVEHEILNAIREAGRNLKLYLSKKEHLATEKKRLDVFEKYLPKVAQFSTKLSKQKAVPDVKVLLKSVMKYGTEETKTAE